MEDGACFEIWPPNTLNAQEKVLLRDYENYLDEYKSGYSFLFSFKIPRFSGSEKKQLKNTIGYVPDEIIYICGLATPLFRSVEAILKYFGGYAKINVGNPNKEFPQAKDKYFTIRKKKYIANILLSSSYQLITWELIKCYFNSEDEKEITEINSFQNFIKTNYGNGRK